MNVPQDDLNLWRRFFDTLRASCREGMAALDAGQPQAARRIMEQTEDAGRRMALRLERAGADRPGAAALTMDTGTPLALLDTPANRRYLEALRTAWECGLAVDRERYGETIGTDGEAQIIEIVLADKELEVFGAVGRVRE